MFGGFLSVNLVLTTILAWFIVFGTTWTFVAYIFIIGRITSMTATLLFLLESSVVRIVVHRILRRVPNLNDEFWTTFLATFNFGLGFFNAGLYLVSGSSAFSQILARIGGPDAAQIHSFRFVVEIQSIRVAVLAFILVGGIDFLWSILNRVQNWWNIKLRQRSVGPAMVQPIDQNINYNNQDRNEEVFNYASQILLTFLSILFWVPSILVYWVWNISNQLNDGEITLLDFSRTLSVLVVLPLIIYSRNSKLRKHCHDKLKFVLNLK